MQIQPYYTHMKQNIWESYEIIFTQKVTIWFSYEVPFIWFSYENTFVHTHIYHMIPIWGTFHMILIWKYLRTQSKLAYDSHMKELFIWVTYVDHDVASLPVIYFAHFGLFINAWMQKRSKCFSAGISKLHRGIIVVGNGNYDVVWHSKLLTSQLPTP